MINTTHHQMKFYHPSLSNKLSVVLESTVTNEREEIINFFYSISSSTNFIFLKGKKVMVPFLSVEDNLLLSLSRKEKKELLRRMSNFLTDFRLEESLLKLPASDVSYSDQLLFLMIRSLILNQTTVLFDDCLNGIQNELFISNILPILNRLTKSQKLDVIIVTKNQQLAQSIYYDQCIFLN